ncbi:hypothetical protein ACBY01_04795 [Sphingomonas sp. ac-8]|uniref:hypothetical protein n=1 Tax=Sphingomonas sp. ac-8 TaxID=3242977 RepID=UPI003A802A8C
MTTRSARWSAAAVALAVLPILAGGSAPPPPDPATLCKASEKPLFSCPIGRKLVSVCAGAAKPVYRYGTAGRVELTSTDLTTASVGYSGGGETQIAATNGAYRYIVYDRTVRTGFGEDGLHHPDFDSGLIVRRGARTLSSRTCSAEPVLGTPNVGTIPPGAFVAD